MARGSTPSRPSRSPKASITVDDPPRTAPGDDQALDAPRTPAAAGAEPGADAGTALDPETFTSLVSAVTNAFGDPTRREIYLFVRDAGEQGATASEVAERFA